MWNWSNGRARGYSLSLLRSIMPVASAAPALEAAAQRSLDLEFRWCVIHAVLMCQCVCRDSQALSE